MAKIDGVVVAEELADVKWASTPVWIHIHHGRRQEEAGDVCVCIILTASKKGIIKTLQHSHCLVQISDGITRWQRETEGERTEKLPAPTIDLSIHLKLASDEANGGRSRNRATNLGVVGATG
jgi:hypothetical protein